MCSTPTLSQVPDFHPSRNLNLLPAAWSATPARRTTSPVTAMPQSGPVRGNAPDGSSALQALAMEIDQIVEKSMFWQRLSASPNVSPLVRTRTTSAPAGMVYEVTSSLVRTSLVL